MMHHTLYVSMEEISCHQIRIESTPWFFKVCLGFLNSMDVFLVISSLMHSLFLF